MFIIHGRRHRHVPMGLGAAFCPMCRAPRLFKVTRIEEHSHLYYIPLSRPKLCGWAIECTGCGLIQSPRKQSFVSAADSTANPSDVIQRAGSSERDGLASRLGLEQRARSRNLLPLERLQLLLEPFGAIDEMYRFRITRMRSFAKPIAFVAIAVCLALIVLVVFSDRPLGGELSLGLAPLIVFGAFVALVVAMNRRLSASRFLPLLAKSLAPLKPSRDEIETVLREYRAHGGSLARRLSAANIEHAIAMSEFRMT